LYVTFVSSGMFPVEISFYLWRLLKQRCRILPLRGVWVCPG
jgi:hypothetical protein